MLKNTTRRTFDSLTMRAAKKADSRDAAKLIYMTGEGIFKYLFYPDMNKTVAIIRQLFEMEDNDFSHQNAYTAKLDRQIAGIIVFKKKQKIENKTLYSRFDFTGLYRMEKEIEG